jgi:hypothetical protein
MDARVGACPIPHARCVLVKPLGFGTQTQRLMLFAILTLAHYVAL